MKHYLKIFISSLLAGFCIVIGASVYLSLLATSKIVGSLLFGFGLFVIINFELHLYTGKVGFILDNKPKYLLDLLWEISEYSDYGMLHCYADFHK